MCWICNFFNSSLGKKFMVAIAGLLLCGFLVTHLAGNLFLFVGEGAFNHYAETLEANPLIVPAEIILALIFLVHILVSLKVRYENKQARPVAYEQQQAKGGRTLGSQTMTVTALLVLAFLIIHIRTFKFGDKPDGLYRLVLNSFSNKYYSLFYVLAMGGLGLHLSHGFQSSFQTLGLNHPKYTPWIKTAGLVFAGVISLGFAMMPLWGYVKGGCR